MASEEGGGWFAPLWGIPSFAWQVFNFVLVIVLFYFLLRKAAPAFFRGRAADIKEALNKAVREKEEALARLKEVEDKMARLDDEVASIEAEAKESAELEKKRVAEEAEAERDRIRREAKDELERRVLSMRRELREYAASLIEKSTREILNREISIQDDDRLMETFFERLEEHVSERTGQ